jgi:hypothetical protein
MKRILIIFAFLFGVAYAQSKAGFIVVGGNVITVQDNDSRAYLKAIEDAGVVPSVNQNFASNYLVTTFKEIGAWTPSLAIYPYIGGTANTHAVNMKTPGTFNLTYFGTLTHSANGIQFDGSTGYASTGLTPNTSLVSTSTNLYTYIRSIGTTTTTAPTLLGATIVDGSNNITDALRLINRNGNNGSSSFLKQYLSSNGTSNDAISTTATTSFLRSFSGNYSSSTLTLWSNGSQILGTSFASLGSSLPLIPITIGASNSTAIGTFNVSFANFQTAGVAISAGLTNTQITQRDNTFNFFNSLLNR